MIERDEAKLQTALLRELGSPFHSGGFAFRRCLLPFDYDGAGNYSAKPQRPFVPRGLAIWGAPAGAVVEQFHIGRELQIVCAFGVTPCRFFALGDSYEQIAKLMDEGKEPPAWVEWDPVVPGHIVRLRITHGRGVDLSPEDGIEIAMWGVCAIG